MSFLSSSVRAIVSDSLASASKLPRRSAAASFSRQRRRALHVPAPHQYDIEEGLGEFLSPAALRTLAVDYQNGVLERLNGLVRGTSRQHETVMETLASAADRQDILTFNYAAEALNNHFFLTRLSPSPEAVAPHKDSRLDQAIKASFGSFEALKEQFTAYAMGMFGSGWVWLAFDDAGRLIIVGTPGAGTIVMSGKEDRRDADDKAVPILGAREAGFRHRQYVGERRRPTVDPPSASQQYEGEDSKQATTVNSRFDALKGWRSDGGLDQIGETLYPLLCLSIHERAWMQDHGLWGKERYAQKFWDQVEWKYMDQFYDSITRLK